MILSEKILIWSILYHTISVQSPWLNIVCYSSGFIDIFGKGGKVTTFLLEVTIAGVALSCCSKQSLQGVGHTLNVTMKRGVLAQCLLEISLDRFLTLTLLLMVIWTQRFFFSYENSTFHKALQWNLQIRGIKNNLISKGYVYKLCSCACSSVPCDYMHLYHMGLFSGFVTKWASNQYPQLQRLGRKLKFCL